MIKVVIAFPLDEVYMDRIREVSGIRCVKAPDYHSLLKEAEDAEVLFTYRLSSEVVKKAKKLKWIQSPFVGVDPILIDEVKKRDIIVTCARGIHYSQASDHVFALILAFARKLPELIEDQKNKVWKVRHPIPFHPLDELKGKTLGVIGVGSTGQEVARKGKCFGMRVIGIKRTPDRMKYVDEVYGVDKLDYVLKESDYVVLCVPFTPETENLIGESELKKMKKTAYLINIARGEVVDEVALVKAIKYGWIAGAALDVVRTEPLLENSELWDLDNVIITPHVAGSTPYYWDRAIDVFVENLTRFLKGKRLINIVDKEKGY
jgi:phosphoglycerate dehydrogenase-like enzyme